MMTTLTTKMTLTPHTHTPHTRHTHTTPHTRAPHASRKCRGNGAGMPVVPKKEEEKDNKTPDIPLPEPVRLGQVALDQAAVNKRG